MNLTSHTNRTQHTRREQRAALRAAAAPQSGGLFENSAHTRLQSLCCDRDGRAPKSSQAFTLVEVMIALGIFFVAVFAILGVMSNALSNARVLQQKTVDAGMVAAELSLTNTITEGLESGDFGDMYPGFTWTRDAYPAGTNGLFQVDIIVQKPNGKVDSTMSVFFFQAAQTQTRPGGGAAAGTPAGRRGNNPLSR